MTTLLIIIAVGILVSLAVGLLLAACINWGMGLSPSEQAEQDKEDLLEAANKQQCGGFWYSQKSSTKETS